jgi:hypothetical protein
MKKTGNSIICWVKGNNPNDVIKVYIDGKRFTPKKWTHIVLTIDYSQGIPPKLSNLINSLGEK